MRSSCLQCTAKHVGNAIILLREARTGYAAHRLLALSELEQASQESEEDYPALSAEIHGERKNIEGNYKHVDSLMTVLWEIQGLIDKEVSDAVATSAPQKQKPGKNRHESRKGRSS